MQTTRTNLAHKSNAAPSWCTQLDVFMKIPEFS